MNDTAQIILAIGGCCVFITAAFVMIVLAIDIIKGWKNDKA